MLKHTSATEFTSMMKGAAFLRGEDKVPFVPRGAVDDDLALRLLAQGFRDSYIDLALSGRTGLPERDFSFPAPTGANILPPVVETPVTPKKAASGKLGLKEELQKAAPVYDQAVACIRRIMITAVSGKLQTGTALEVMEGIVSSLARNPDAMLCLPRLRRSDAYTYMHCVNVAALLAGFALRSCLDRGKALLYGLAGLFHDLGKALLPVSLLNARRKLSPTEQTLVTRHPMLGFDLLSSLPYAQPELLQASLEHHERYNGSGYPKGLAGNAISGMGRLVAIADFYDALSSRRPYKTALNPHKTLGVMYQMRKKAFHPEQLDHFVRMVGIYPAGSVVELEDGHRGIVTAGNYVNPKRPVVTLVMDPRGRSLRPRECDMAKGETAAIVRCLAPELSGIDLCRTLGLSA